MSKILNNSRKSNIASYIIIGLSRKGVSSRAFAWSLNIHENYILWLKKVSTYQKIPVWAWSMFDEIYNKQTLDSILNEIKANGLQKKPVHTELPLRMKEIKQPKAKEKKTGESPVMIEGTFKMPLETLSFLLYQGYDIKVKIEKI